MRRLPGGGRAVQLYLVRSARAEKRSQWRGPGGGRPLTEEGRRQADGLVSLLGADGIRTIACGPSLRSRQTLGPLAEALGLPLTIDDRLDRDAPIQQLVARVRELGERGAVVCLHRGGVLETVAQVLGAGSAELEDRCERGAAWMLEGDPVRATYFSPRRSLLPTGGPVARFARIPLHTQTATGSNPPRVAVLDLGSTSFHLLVGEWTAEGEIRRVGRERVMLRMGAELARSGGIGPALAERSAEAVRELCAAAHELKAEQIVAVATSALRDAANGAAVVGQLEEALGGPIHLLSGEEEARIIFRAIRARVDLGGHTTVGLDLGGGSLELVVGNDDEILFERTLPLGVARLHGTIEPADPHRESDLRKLRHQLRQELRPVAKEIRAFEPAGCVAVGGTARAVAQLITRGRNDGGPDSLRGVRLAQRDLDALARDLGALSLEDRLRRPGVSARRADLLPFGAEILNATLSLLGANSLTLCDWGLREGVLLEVHSAGG